MVPATPRCTLGVGVAEAADAAGLIGLAKRAIALAGHPVIGAIATIDSRAQHPAIRALAGHLGLEVLSFPVAVLESESPRLLNPSDAVFAKTGCHGVAEAAALASAGPDGQLLVGKLKAEHATVAIAVG